MPALRHVPYDGSQARTYAKTHSLCHRLRKRPTRLQHLQHFEQRMPRGFTLQFEPQMTALSSLRISETAGKIGRCPGLSPQGIKPTEGASIKLKGSRENSTGTCEIIMQHGRAGEQTSALLVPEQSSICNIGEYYEAQKITSRHFDEDRNRDSRISKGV